MTAPYLPLTAALKGVKANGMYGNVFSDLGKAVSGLAGEAKADREKQQEMALKQALQDFELKKFTYTQDHDAKELGLKERDLASKVEDRKIDNTRLAQGQEALNQNRALVAALSGRRLDETERHNSVTEGQGDQRIEQGTIRMGETQRHHAVTEAQGDARLSQSERRLAQAGYQKVQLESGEWVWLPKPGMEGAVSLTGNRPPATPATPETNPVPKEPTVAPGATVGPHEAAPAPTGIVQTGVGKKADSNGTIHTGEFGSGADAPSAMQTAHQSNQSAIEKIDAAMAEVRADPDAVGLKRALGDFVNQRIDPKGIPARSAISDLSSLVLHERSGANVTKIEIPRQRGWMPEEHNTAEAVLTKLQKMKERFELANKNIEAGYPMDTQVSRGENGPVHTPPPTEAVLYYQRLKEQGFSPEEAERQTDLKFGASQ